jgi:hypothetical protein
MFARLVRPPATKRITRALLGRDAFLEVREVPAKMWWTGEFGTSFTGNPGPPARYSWKIGDTPGTAVPANRDPTADDDIYFDHRVSSNNCTWASGTHSVKSLHLINGYQGTVQVAPIMVDGNPTGRTVGDFELTTGNIDQASGAPITVSGTFIWTGGVLDSSTDSPSYLTMTGAEALAVILLPIGSGATELQTANTIKAEAGARIEFGFGTVKFTAAGGIELSNATANVYTDGANTRHLTLKKPAGGPIPVVTLNPGSQYNVRRMDQTAVGAHTSELPFQVNGGRLYVEGGIHMTVSGRLPGNGPGVHQTSGQTLLTCGSTLDVRPGGFRLSGGRFTTHVNVDGSNADLAGDMTVDGSTARVEFDRASPGYFGTFKVLGAVNWTAGTYWVPIGVTTSGFRACLWEATGQITVGTGARVGVVETTSIGIGDDFLILKGARINGGPAATSDKYRIDPDGPPATEWVLVKTRL